MSLKISFVKLTQKIIDSRRTRKILTYLQYFITLVVFVFLFRWSQGVSIPKLNFLFLLLSVLAVVVLRVLSALRLRMLLRGIAAIRFSKLFPIQLFSIGLGLFTPAKMGESIKILMLTKEKELRKKIGTVFLLEKILDAAIFLPLLLLFILWNGTYFKYFLGLFFLFVVAVLAYLKIKKFSQVNLRLIRLEVLMITLSSFLSQIISFWLVILASGNKISFLNAAIIWSVAGVITIISALPGGLGARELSLAYLLSLMAGIQSDVAVSLALAYTVINYLTTWIFIFLSMFFSRRRLFWQAVTKKLRRFW